MNLFESSDQDLSLAGGSHCILMLHGLGSGPLELAQLAKEAHLEGFSVHVPSIRGYCFGDDLKHWSDWFEQVQTHYWEAREKYETVSVVGLSMGASLALLLAQHEQPTANVFLAPALGYDGWAMPWYRFLLPWAHWIPFSKRYRYQEKEPFGVKNEQTRAMVKRMLATHSMSEVGGAYITLDQIREGQALMDHVRRHVSDIESPSLFIHAIDDESVHVRHAEQVFHNISSRDKEFIYLGDSYHIITVDNERETVHAQTLRFIKQRINSATGEAVFELPVVLSPELRRYLAHKMES